MDENEKKDGKNSQIIVGSEYEETEFVTTLSASSCLAHIFEPGEELLLLEADCVIVVHG